MTRAMGPQQSAGDTNPQRTAMEQRVVLPFRGTGQAGEVVQHKVHEVQQLLENN